MATEKEERAVVFDYGIRLCNNCTDQFINMSPDRRAPRFTPEEARRAEFVDARVKLLRYLREGERSDGAPYSTQQRVVYKRDTLHPALLAGYTEYALSQGFIGGVATLVRGPGTSATREDDFFYSIHYPDRYGREPAYYNGVESLKWIVKNHTPDLTYADDPLRNHVLDEVSKFKELKPRIYKASGEGIMWLADPKDWYYMPDGTVTFWLNASGSTKIASGHFTADQYRALTEGDQSSPILVKNEKEQPFIDGLERLRLIAEQTRKEMQDIIDGNIAFQADAATRRRMLHIALMRCPESDIVQEFAPRLEEIS